MHGGYLHRRNPQKEWEILLMEGNDLTRTLFIRKFLKEVCELNYINNVITASFQKHK